LNFNCLIILYSFWLKEYNKITASFKNILQYLLRPLCLFSFLILSGCITQTARLADPTINQLRANQHWQVKGRVAVQTKDENLSATLEWEKSARNFDFHIYGLFGATYTHLIQNGDKATLKLPEDQVFHHKDAQALMDRQLGWNFPIDALGYWIKGLASGKKGEKVTRDINGQLQAIDFRGWHVSFSRYQEFSGYHMPKIIKAKHPQMTLKIAVKKWYFETPE
jgi:outer membrane lipoprotein LolB